MAFIGISLLSLECQRALNHLKTTGDDVKEKKYRQLFCISDWDKAFKSSLKDHSFTDSVYNMAQV